MAIQNSPQYDDFTTSNDGRNVRASLQWFIPLMVLFSFRSNTLKT